MHLIPNEHVQTAIWDEVHDIRAFHRKPPNPPIVWENEQGQIPVHRRLGGMRRISPSEQATELVEKPSVYAVFSTSSGEVTHRP